MSMGQGMGNWHAIRSFTQDRSVTKQKLAPGTVKRIVRFARPYRGLITILLILLAVDAALGTVTPLLVREILNKGIAQSRPHLVIGLAAVMAVIAVFDSALALVERYFSSRIGEGLIFDMRAKVFAHIQRMPIAFFTRTQTGALISRLNNDVLGAQQAFTGTLVQRGEQPARRRVDARGDVQTVLADHPRLAGAAAGVRAAGAADSGASCSSITRESYGLNAADEHDHDRAVQRRGSAAGQAVRPAASEEAAAFRAKAGRVRDIGVTPAMYGRIFFVALMLVAALATALVYGWGGVLARPAHAGHRHRWSRSRAYLARLYGPLTALSNVQVDVMTALVSFERVFEVLDLPPMIADDARRRRVAAHGRHHRVRPRRFRYPARRRGLAGLAGVGGRPRRRPRAEVLHDVSLHRRSPASWSRWSARPAPARRRSRQLVPQMYDVHGGAVRVGGVDVRDVDAAFAARRRRRRHPGRAHVPRHDRANLALRPAGRHRRPAVARRCEAAQIGDLVRRSPTGSTPSSASAAIGSPVARSSAWRSPGCC